MDDVIRGIFENLDTFKIVGRETSGSGDAYKNVIAEKTFHSFVVDDIRDVIINNTVFKNPPFMVIDEILSQWFNMNPPLMAKYRQDISKYYKLNKMGHVEYTYGARFNEWNQFDRVLSILTERLDSKRAIVQIYTPYDTDPSRKDVPCTLFYHFIVRENKLHTFVAYRSHDLYAGVKVDYVFVSFLNQFLVSALNDILGVNLEPGELHVHESSLHYYPSSVKNGKNLVLDSFVLDKEKRRFVVFKGMKLQEMIDDLRSLKAVEDIGHSELAIKRFRTIKDPVIRDFARVLASKNKLEPYGPFETEAMWW